MNDAMNSPFLEKLFENATEDISTYNWAVELWPERNEEYSAGHLLITAVSSRARGLLALKRIASEELSEDYKFYQEKLQHMLDKAEAAFKHLVVDHTEELQSLFQEGGELWDRLSSLDLQLKHVRHIAQDGMLLQDEEWESDDFREAAHDFLLYFSDIHYLAYDPPKELAAFAAFTAWGLDFENVEKQFRAWFGYFAPVSDLLNVLSQREYEPGFWWFTETPMLDKVTGSKLTDERVRALGRLLDVVPPEKCPDQELIIAYAMDELSGQKRLDVQSHVNKCPLCTKHVLDVRFAVAQGEARKDEAVAVPDVLIEAIKNPAKRLQKILGDLQALEPSLAMPDTDRILSTVHDIIDLSHVLPLVKPPRELLPMAAKDAEGRKIESIFANKVEIISGELKDFEVFPVKIVDKVYEDGILSVYVEIPKGLRQKDYAWNCCWESKNGEVAWPDPGTFRVDTDTGFISAEFSLTDRPDGMFRLSILHEVEP